jgi:hypothetical protein
MDVIVDKEIEIGDAGPHAVEIGLVDRWMSVEDHGRVWLVDLEYGLAEADMIAAIVCARRNAVDLPGEFLLDGKSAESVAKEGADSIKAASARFDLATAIEKRDGHGIAVSIWHY